VKMAGVLPRAVVVYCIVTLPKIHNRLR